MLSLRRATDAGVFRLAQDTQGSERDVVAGRIAFPCRGHPATDDRRCADQAVHADPTIRVMFTPEQIQARVREMGLEVARDLGAETRRPLYVGVLKGACMFQCDLARATPLDVELDFLALSSYGAGTTSSGTVRLVTDLRTDLNGRHVVVCEGVVDSGHSL